jgi:type II secretory pathway predicted ATPase ExeA
MYAEYFGLREKPFRKTPDPRYLYLSEGHEEALEQLLFAVEEMELALLTGEVGAGKTLLTRALVDRVGDSHEIGMILNPRLPPRQFLSVVAAELGVVEPRFRSNELLGQIHERLLALDEAGRPALLIVDEAHLIPGRATFEEIRLLTNFQLDDRNLIAVVLVGQPELRARLQKKAFRPLTQRIGADFHLRPLDAAEAGDYVRHRLAVAGGVADLFSEAAVARLHQASAGIPRVLNHLATQALLDAMARGLTAVDEASAAAAADSQGFRPAEWPAPVVVEGRPGLHVAAREPDLPKAGRWGG